MGIVTYLGMAAALFVVPALFNSSRPLDEAGGDASSGSRASLFIERVLEVEGWGSEGAAGLAAEVSSRLSVPTWVEVRRAMERRGCTDLRYALRIRCLHRDGSQSDQTLIRRPYHEPHHSGEFIRFLREGPDSAARFHLGDLISSPTPADIPPPFPVLAE